MQERDHRNIVLGRKVLNDRGGKISHNSFEIESIDENRNLGYPTPFLSLIQHRTIFS